MSDAAESPSPVPNPHENEAWRTEAVAGKGENRYDVRTDGDNKIPRFCRCFVLRTKGRGVKKFRMIPYFCILLGRDEYVYVIYVWPQPQVLSEAKRRRAAREIYLNCSPDSATNIPRGHSFKIKH